MARQHVCPHCNSSARINKSRRLSEISKETYFQCGNTECGFCWRALTTAVVTLVPSMSPNPKVHIPMSEKVLAMQKKLATAPPG